MTAALDGVRVIELGAIGPAPFAAMMLADFGADVVRIDRPEADPTQAQGRDQVLHRNRRSIVVDLKHPRGAEIVLRLVEDAAVLLEGWRPGVAERLGVGPERCLERQPALVYGRMTGYGQHGPLAGAVGHDVNYLALSGALGAMGPADAPPVFPVNFLGDFGGGGMILAFGVLAALRAAERTGCGQVVDASMTDGVALLTAHVHGLRAAGAWHERGMNTFDGGSHFYNVYETSDGQHVAVGVMEPKFYAALLEVLELDDKELPDQLDRAGWATMKERLAAIFRTRTRDEWCARFEGRDACFSPVLSLDEAPAHPHHVARQSFLEIEGAVHPAPSPRLSRTPADVRRPPPLPGEHAREVLELSFTSDEVAALFESGAVR